MKTVKKVVSKKIKEQKSPIIQLLQSALADEWLAHYQYWVGSKIAVGPLRPSVVAEFNEHAKQEYDHANKLADRILQLGGEILTHPKDWFTKSNCGYQVPSIPGVIQLLKQNIDGELCAIEVYKKIITMADKADPVTYYLAIDILKEEEAHRYELQSLLDDILEQQKICCK